MIGNRSPSGSLEQVVTAARAGDGGAFEQLVRALRERVCEGLGQLAATSAGAWTCGAVQARNGPRGHTSS